MPNETKHEVWEGAGIQMDIRMSLIVGKIVGSGGGQQQVLCLVFHLTYFQLLLFSSWCLILKDLKVRKCRVYFSREGLRKE